MKHPSLPRVALVRRLFLPPTTRDGRRTPLVAVALALLAAQPALAQEDFGFQEALRDVLPGAQRFSGKQGNPPVFRGLRADPSTGKETLVGYAFLTSDLPPEEPGYNAPIQVLVGMDTTGRITGARVLYYRESLMQSRGDFLRRPGFQEQFAGKSFTDPFRVRRDVDNISGATITVGALSRGMRNAARRIASTYLAGPGARRPGQGPVLAVGELEGLQWPDLVNRGVVQRITVLDGDMVAMDVSLMHARDEAIASTLLGRQAFDKVVERAGERVPQDHLLILGVDGPLAALFRAQALKFVQGGDTLKLVQNDVILLGEPREGMIDGEFRNAGIAFLSRSLDMDRPLTMIVDLRPGLGLFSAEYAGRRVAVARAPAARESDTTASDAGASANGATAPPAGSAPEAPADDDAAPAPVSVETAAAPEEAAAEATPEAEPLAELPQLSFDDAEEETILARTLAQTSWARVGLLVALLALVSAAFFTKHLRLRWVALAGTVVVLGFGGGGFLSVSHITSAIRVGPSVFLNDLPLLLLVAFTVVTTLVWGRVFCGFLCPFGALQDFLEKVVPRRFRRELPERFHERALLVKYGVLGLIVLPVMAGSSLVLFQYFEPFGTVFFMSSSVLLWAIALALLAACAIVPRFYCRYVCPLGASLALASLLSPLRIRRVEQCAVCTVCERACPTGAIQGSKLDFKECVRCNVCEVKLAQRAGVCRHDWADVQPRLITLKMGPRQGMADVA